MIIMSVLHGNIYCYFVRRRLSIIQECGLACMVPYSRGWSDHLITVAGSYAVVTRSFFGAIGSAGTTSMYRALRGLRLGVFLDWRVARAVRSILPSVGPSAVGTR